MKSTLIILIGVLIFTLAMYPGPTPAASYLPMIVPQSVSKRVRRRMAKPRARSAPRHRRESPPINTNKPGGPRIG
jgi:hypothetical protein